MAAPARGHYVLVAGAALGAAAAGLVAATRAHRRRRGRAEVEHVLAFWLGAPGGEDDEQLRCARWFPPPNSAAQATADALIAAEFDGLVRRAAAGALEEWGHAPRSALALIIVLDQLARHLRRVRGDAPAQALTDERALAWCEQFVARGWHAELRGAALVFALMPLRHSPTVPRLERVLELLDAREAAAAAASETVARFRAATLSRLQHMRGATAGDPLDVLEHQPFDCDMRALRREPLYAELCAFLARRGQLGALPRPAHGAQPAGQPPPPIVISLSGGVDSMVIAQLVHAACTAPLDAPERSPPPAAAAEHVAQWKRQRSADAALAPAEEGGGARAPRAPRKKRWGARGRAHAAAAEDTHGCAEGAGGAGARAADGELAAAWPCVVAIHIDYSNRCESAAEADFVQRWCEERGIVFRKRVISEVSRAGTAREEYELQSRLLRYAAYRSVLEQTGGRAVLFGHHLGDVRENVLANVMKGGSVLELGGMGEESVVSGVTVWRPLLGCEKEAIYALARRHGVPWLKDTTPAWSTRGRTRNELVPLLESMYGAGHRTHLNALAADCAQLRALVHSALFQPFWEQADVSPVCACVPCAQFASRPPFWWREALRVLCESRLGVGLVKERAVASLLFHLRRSPPHTGWLSLKRENRALLMEGGRLALFRAPLFPLRTERGRSEWVRCGAEWWFRRARGLPETARCLLRVGETAVFGPWTVELSRVPLAAACLGEAVSMADVLRGTFAYALPDVGRMNGNAEEEAAAACGLELCAGAARRDLPPALLQLDPTLRCALPNVLPATRAQCGAGEGAAQAAVEAERDTAILVRCEFDGCFAGQQAGQPHRFQPQGGNRHRGADYEDVTPL